jgi:hypothetical protein
MGHPTAAADSYSKARKGKKTEHSEKPADSGKASELVVDIEFSGEAPKYGGAPPSDIQPLVLAPDFNVTKKRQGDRLAKVTLNGRPQRPPRARGGPWAPGRSVAADSEALPTVGGLRLAYQVRLGGYAS